MAHRVDGRKLGRKQGPRLALYRNLVVSILRYEQVRTTEAKAKEIRRWVEKLVTTAKTDDLQSRRQVAEVVTRADVAAKLFTQYAERFQDRPGGYTRIIGKGPRQGDGAPVVIMEFVD